ncbi:pyridoxamine 5'-phosphate oxidase family protein [Granulicoccus sp. GXG6511]|uniref:pyridoxamine 5'-phosphate oxidase family protein n=1 Tax=Granulicoccus sp. GXG6511 TaxID=3381351 RepID=UPI003D7D62F7
MARWAEFAAGAPIVSEVFRRRHAATGQLCFLGTLRADGWPRVSPVEPVFFGDDLFLIGMPNTRKFDDLARDPRFTVHTATVDTEVKDDDAKIWGVVEDDLDANVHRAIAEDMFARTGFDLRGETPFQHCFRCDISGGSAARIRAGRFEVVLARTGTAERVIPKS